MGVSQETSFFFFVDFPSFWLVHASVSPVVVVGFFFFLVLFLEMSSFYIFSFLCFSSLFPSFFIFLSLPLSFIFQCLTFRFEIYHLLPAYMCRELSGYWIFFFGGTFYSNRFPAWKVVKIRPEYLLVEILMGIYRRGLSGSNPGS